MSTDRRAVDDPCEPDWHPLLDLVEDAFFHRLATTTESRPARLRHQIVQQYAWGCPSFEAIDAIVALGPVVDVMAGTGYWARLIHNRGGDVLAFDAALALDNVYHSAEHPRWYDIEQMDCEDSARLCPDRTLLLCWPPYNFAAGYRAVEAHHAAGGQLVVYVGEGSGGCTGDDALHEFLERNYDIEQTISIPQWYGIHDYVEVNRRR